MGYLTTNAKITLEHTYTVDSSGSSFSVINLSNSGYKYMLVNYVPSPQIKLYNTNHSLWKTINIPAIFGYSFAVYNISESLFNTNSQVEFLCIYYSGNPRSYVKIIDENGTVIKDFPNRSLYDKISVVKTSKNTYKLILSDGKLIREVYSLPGTQSNVGVPNIDKVSKLGNSYPNPTSQKITIPYDLSNSSSTGLLNIYSVSGQFIESLTIDNSFKNIQLDLTNYASGLYYYNITINGNKSTSKSFVKN